MVHLPPLITDLALILGAAGITSLLFKKIKQPMVLGYILAGALVGPHLSLFPTVEDNGSIQVWAEIGVVFLLFSLGLEFSFKKLVKVGGSASITAVFEVVFMLMAGYITGKVLGWSTMDSIFLGGILSISSTTIIIRAFDELGVKTQKFASLVFGILIVEDLVAILLLVLLSTVAVTQQFAGEEMVRSILKLAFFLILWFVGGIFFIPTMFNKLRKLLNEETILIISLGLCFTMVVFSTYVGFSPALGAFIMGSIIAETSFGEKVEELFTPIKGLFGAIFFVSVGMLIDPRVLLEFAFPILVITIVTIIGKLISSTIGALVSGQALKQSVQTGMSLAQIGEFSFIIASLGLTLKVTEGFLYPIAVAVSAITTFTTPFLINASAPMARALEGALPERWLTNLNKYSSSTQVMTATSDWKILIKATIFNTVVHSVIITSILIFVSRFIYPAMSDIFQARGAGYLTMFITFSLIAPFIWALSVRRIKKDAYYNLWMNSRLSKGPLVIIDLLRVSVGIIFATLIIGKYVDDLIETAVFIITASALIFYSSKVLQKFYNRIEARFLLNLHDKESGLAEVMPKVVPWDGHLSQLKVSSRSTFAGKTLLELSLREKFGVNIVFIERQGLTIPVPGKDERLYPGDTVYLIGTDEELAKIKPHIEVAESFGHEAVSKKDQLVLQKIVIDHDCPLVSLSISTSGIKEKARSMVVGMERDGERILNPHHKLQFRTGDIVWIAGDPKALAAFLRTGSNQRSQLVS